MFACDIRHSNIDNWPKEMRGNLTSVVVNTYTGVLKVNRVIWVSSEINVTWYKCVDIVSLVIY